MEHRMTQYTIEDLAKMRDGLTTLHKRTSLFSQEYSGLPATGSQAVTELSTYGRPESLVTAHSIGTQLIEFGAEHLTAFVKIVTEPVEVIACWTCVRSMLESCSLCAWLLDPDIDANTRVGRTFALRYEGIDQHLKLARILNKPEHEIKTGQDRIDEVEKTAIGLGFAPLLDKKGHRIGIGQKMPSATDMIESMLNEGIAYRLLSGVAHGHSWAIIQLGFQPVKDATIGGVATKGFEKTNDLSGIMYLGFLTMKSLAMPLWKQCHYFGWDALRLEEMLEDAADASLVLPTARFWRS